jgi:hypothetical protein
MGFLDVRLRAPLPVIKAPDGKQAADDNNPKDHPAYRSFAHCLTPYLRALG